MEILRDSPDLMGLICSHLDRGSALAVALTYRGFMEVGLDRVWGRLDSFSPIVTCLPDDLLGMYRQHPDGLLRWGLKSRLSPKHLERYLTFYAPRIRILEFKENGLLAIPDTTFFQALQFATDCIPGALSPSLEAFDWPDPRDDTGCHLAPFVSLFLGRSVRSLTLRTPALSELPIPYEGSLHFNATRLCHSIQELNFALSSCRFVVQFLSSFTWNRLRKVTVAYVNPKVLSHLAALPHLCCLEVTDGESNMCYVDNIQPAPTARDFPSLRVLVFKLFDISYARRMMKCLPPNNGVERLDCISLWEHPCASQCQHVVDAVREYCNPLSLTHLSIRHDEHRAAGNKDMPREVRVEDPVGEVDLSPLYPFQMMESLTIQSRDGQVSLPAAVGMTAAAWPELQHLNLCPTYPSFGLTPSMDHTHLLTILHGCPSLRYLGLRFDTKRITARKAPQTTMGDQPASSASTRADMSRLYRLRVGESPISSPAQVLEFFRQHLPNVRVLDWSYDSTSAWETSLPDKRWARVAQELDSSDVW